MKVAVTAAGKTPEDPVDQRLGRAQGFILFGEDDSWQYVDNRPNVEALSGAGVQAAQDLADRGVAAVVTGHVGPKAYSVLSAAGIKVYIGASGTVKEAYEAYKAGRLQEAQEADRPGHW